MVLLTLCIGTLNLLLGFALAVHLGYARSPVGVDRMPLIVQQFLTRPPTQEKLQQEELEALEQFVDGVDAMPLESLLDDEELEIPDIDLETEVYDEPEEEEIAYQLASNDMMLWDLDEKFVEMSILNLNVAMIKSGESASRLDSLLREKKGSYTQALIEQCLQTLRTDCESYLIEQKRATEAFANRIEELGELASLGEEIEMANLEQASQIETTINNLASIDIGSDPQAAGRRLLAEISKLREARHHLRDTQEKAFLAVARSEGRIDIVEARLLIDPLTKLANRIGIETTMRSWWQENTGQPMASCLLDLDGFTKINEKIGCEMGDKILQQLASWLPAQITPEDLVGRFAGQQLLILLKGQEIEAAERSFEQLRQSMANINFQLQEEEIRLTACSATTATSHAELEDGAFFRRLEEAMQAAKKEGPGSTFVARDDKIESLEPVELETQELVFQL